MFTDEILERLYAIKEMKKLTLEEQSTLIDAFEAVMEEEERKNNATLSEP